MSLSLWSVLTGSCVFTVVSDFYFSGAGGGGGGVCAANCNSRRYPNYVLEFYTAFRKQLSLWRVAPVRRKRLHF